MVYTVSNPKAADDELVEVIKVEFYDGSVFVLRKDRCKNNKACMDLVAKVSAPKKLALKNMDDATRLQVLEEARAKLGGAIRLTTLKMRADEYEAIPKADLIKG